MLLRMARKDSMPSLAGTGRLVPDTPCATGPRAWPAEARPALAYCGRRRFPAGLVALVEGLARQR